MGAAPSWRGACSTHSFTLPRMACSMWTRSGRHVPLGLEPLAHGLLGLPRDVPTRIASWFVPVRSWTRPASRAEADDFSHPSCRTLACRSTSSSRRLGGDTLRTAST